jgi:hypothetical protein
MSHRLTDRIAPWIDQAVDAHAGGDQVSFEMSLHQIPNGGFGLAVVLFMPGAVLGSIIHSVSIVGHPLGMTEEEAGGMVRSMIENLRMERSKQLAGGNGHSAQEILPPRP